MQNLLIALASIQVILSIIMLVYMHNKLKSFRDQNSLDSDFQQLKEDLAKQFQMNRMEIINAYSARQTELFDSTYKHLNQMRDTMDRKLQELQNDNHVQLDKMRQTVDHQLQETLEKRLGSSFSIVSKHLEEVQKGLGAMQQLAQGVGDLKKVLSNVKTRGVMGEVQLAAILDQLLVPSQYQANVKTKKHSNAYVEFAIKLPGKDSGQHLWLPIDAKFPLDPYEKLLDAYDQEDPSILASAKKTFSRQILKSAGDIRDKYIDPPNTTDFAILFLPFEGLFAEALRDAELFDALSKNYRVILTGPTTLAAFLSSLQMGFRTLAIEKRSSEVWQLLSVVKTEFSKFGQVLEKSQKKAQELTNSLDQAGVRTRAIERKLHDIPLTDEIDAE